MEKKLIPIIITGNTTPNGEIYSYGGANVVNPRIIKSKFVSAGRLTPECKYTQFTGPDNDSTGYAINLYPGNEVIFASLPNYTYRVKFRVEGFMKFWRYISRINLAYQVYDKNGDLAEYTNCEGCRFFNSKAFPIVVELSQGGKVELEIEAYKELTVTNDPFATGDFCIEGNHVYENSKNLTQIIRHMNPKYQAFNDEFRTNYFSISSGPCLIVSPETVKSSTQIINITSGITLSNFNAKITNFFFARRCYDYMWLNLSTNSTTLFNLSPTFYYIHCENTGSYKLSFNISVVFTSEFYHRCNQAVALCLFDSQTNFVVFDTLGVLINKGYEFKADTSVSLEAGKYYYFAVVNFIHTITPNGGIIAQPKEITNGSFRFTL